MQTSDNWSGDVRNVGKHARADSLRNFPDAFEVDDARVGGGAADD